MWNKFVRTFKKKQSVSTDNVEETLVATIGKGMDIEAFAEAFAVEFARAAEMTHKQRQEFSTSALFSEQSIDLFVDVCDKIFIKENMSENVNMSIISLMWLRIARDVRPDENGQASIMDYLDIARNWHIKILDRIKNRPSSEYFMLVTGIGRSLVYSVKVLDTIVSTEGDEDE